MNSGNADIEPHIKFEQDVLLECSTMCYVAGCMEYEHEVDWMTIFYLYLKRNLFLKDLIF